MKKEIITYELYCDKCGKQIEEGDKYAHLVKDAVNTVSEHRLEYDLCKICSLALTHWLSPDSVLLKEIIKAEVIPEIPMQELEEPEQKEEEPKKQNEELEFLKKVDLYNEDWSTSKAEKLKTCMKNARITAMDIEEMYGMSHSTFGRLINVKLKPFRLYYKTADILTNVLNDL